MLESYNKDVKEFISQTGFPVDQILDIESHPLMEILLKFFNYNKTNIQNYSKAFDLKKTFFLYHSSQTKNAAAQGYNNCNVIFITNGLFTISHEILCVLNIHFDKIAFSQYQNLNKKNSYSLGKLMFESGMVFTFYHEFAHLVQRKDGNFEMAEHSENKNEFDQYRHILEYDSDLCGCNFVIGLIEQYIYEHPNDFNTMHDKLNLHWLALSSITITMLLFLNDFENSKADRTLYLKDKIHPHPAIRIHYIIQHYVFNMKVFGKEVAIQDGLNNCFRYCNSFFEGKDIFIHYFEQISENLNAINNYCDELYDIATVTPNLVRHLAEKFNL